VVIGGIAIQFWGSVRFTEDVDFTIETPLVEGSQGIVELITRHYPSRITEPFDFARTARLILITAPNQVTVDIALALPGYEDEIFARSKEFEISPGKSIKVCSPEDLIIHKAVAGRARDMEDILGLIQRLKKTLDTDYITLWLERFSTIYESDHPMTIFNNIWQEG
jgi:predicted nucleotidyltransferase